LLTLLLHLKNFFANTGVPTQYWKYWRSIQFQNWFSRPWKSIEIGQNVH